MCRSTMRKLFASTDSLALYLGRLWQTTISDWLHQMQLSLDAHLCHKDSYTMYCGCSRTAASTVVITPEIQQSL